MGSEMTHSTKLRVILWFDKLTTPRKIEGRRIEG